MDLTIKESGSSGERKSILHEKGIITLPNGKQYKIVLGDKALTEEQEKSLGELAAKLLNEVADEKGFEDLSETKITHEGVIKKASELEAVPLKPSDNKGIIEEINSPGTWALTSFTSIFTRPFPHLMAAAGQDPVL